MRKSLRILSKNILRQLNLDSVAVLGIDQGEKLLAGLLCPECPEHGRGDGGGMLFLDAAHHHTKMACLNHHPDPLGLNHPLNGFGYLDRHALLNLQPASKDFHQPRQLC